MRETTQGAAERVSRLPLFPLKTALFPGGRLALRIFEQRYVAMAKVCLTDETPFGVCVITRGEEVAAPEMLRAAPEIADIGTLAFIRAWDMPQLGILNVTTEGGTRFRITSHAVENDGLVVADVVPIAAEPPVAIDDAHRPLVDLLEILAARVGPLHFPDTRAIDDASWVGYRLAELLPLPLAVKQDMLAMNDAAARLDGLQRFITERGLLRP
jgi:Lon protease-like protein